MHNVVALALLAFVCLGLLALTCWALLWIWNEDATKLWEYELNVAVPMERSVRDSGVLGLLDCEPFHDDLAWPKRPCAIYDWSQDA